MAYEVFVGTRLAVQDRLNNVLVLGPIAASGLPVGGKTLIFTAPTAVTLTFSGSAGDLLSLAQIVAELEAGVTGLSAARRKAENAQQYSADLSGNMPPPMLLLALWSATGVGISSTGTANADFGLSTNDDTARAAPVAIAKIAGFNADSSPGTYAVVIDLS